MYASARSTSARSTGWLPAGVPPSPPIVAGSWSAFHAEKSADVVRLAVDIGRRRRGKRSHVDPSLRPRPGADHLAVVDDQRLHHAAARVRRGERGRGTGGGDGRRRRGAGSRRRPRDGWVPDDGRRPRPGRRRRRGARPTAPPRPSRPRWRPIPGGRRAGPVPTRRRSRPPTPARRRRGSAGPTRPVRRHRRPLADGPIQSSRRTYRSPGRTHSTPSMRGPGDHVDGGLPRRVDAVGRETGPSPAPG